MGQSVISDSIVTEVAAESEYPIEDLERAIMDVNDALQSRFTYHYKEAKLRRGTDHLAMRLGDSDFWFALTFRDVIGEVRRADLDIERKLLFHVADAHLADFQDSGFTLSIPLKLARRRKDPMYYPIHVDPPQEWSEVRYHTFQQLREFTSRHEMTAAEALDFWISEEANVSNNEWAAYRGVDPEAVRKNIRQAKEKYGDPNLGASLPEQRILTERLEEIPEGDRIPQDDDRMYIPHRDVLEKMELDEGAGSDSPEED